MSLYARALALRLHAGQLDEAGRPYAEKLTAKVTELMRMFPDVTDAEIEAAWLQDAVRRGHATFALLRVAGLSATALAILEALDGHDDLAGLARAGAVSAIRIRSAVWSMEGVARHRRGLPARGCGDPAQIAPRGAAGSVTDR